MSGISRQASSIGRQSSGGSDGRATPSWLRVAAAALHTPSFALAARDDDGTTKGVNDVSGLDVDGKGIGASLEGETVKSESEVPLVDEVCQDEGVTDRAANSSSSLQLSQPHLATVLRAAHAETRLARAADESAELAAQVAAVEAEGQLTTEALHSSILQLKEQTEREAAASFVGGARLSSLFLSSRSPPNSSPPDLSAQLTTTVAALRNELQRRDEQLTASETALASTRRLLDEQSAVATEARQRLREVEMHLEQQQEAWRCEPSTTSCNGLLVLSSHHPLPSVQVRARGG